MNKKWRPNDWNKKVKELAAICCVPGQEIMTLEDIIEASADTMLEAAKKSLCYMCSGGSYDNCKDKDDCWIIGTLGD